MTDLLYAGVYPASWLYHPSTKGFAKEAQAEHQASIAAAKAQKEADRKRREERLQQYLELPPPLKLDRNLRQLRLSQAKMQKLTVFVPWDNSFGVPRIVWQSAVLVYIAKIELEQGYGNYFPCQINANACLNWLRTVFVVTPKVEDGDSIALWKYCKHLEMLGILRYLTHKEFDLMIATSKWHEI